MGCKCSINERDHKGTKLQVGKSKGRNTLEKKMPLIKMITNNKPDRIKSSEYMRPGFSWIKMTLETQFPEGAGNFLKT
jgi:hypothetical protein